MNTFKGMPITGAKPQMSKKRPFVPNAKDTSANEEAMIKEPPAPFKNNLSTPQMPTGVGKSPYETRKTVGVRALPPRGPVGQKRPINQSGQVNGRFGTKFPRKSRPNTTSFPTKRNASFYGE